ncbi:peptidoglycan-associated lipoprotein Pal [Flexibacterium corallicola]|uniref:peptidoglycan-associated lipoprotein Pal n=1 Tax=Flexibacterium corallicola TaxID=3037259 RepID=UPI00286EE5F5|nr:peptidoglycan-associated lipoprotein Pal [Pseudovibrio sp. M1P-2-3]
MNRSVFARAARVMGVIAVCMVAAACAQNRTQAPGGAGSVVAGSAQDFVVNVGDRVYFLNNQSTLSPTARTTLDKQAQWLKAYSKYTVTIEGHADERGTRQYNIALGARRASAVRDYLVARGVSTSRIKTLSYGKERPIAVCDNDSCWSQNRRAVTVVNNAR